MSFRVGSWYMVTPKEEGADVVWQKEMVDKAEPKVRGVSLRLSLLYQCINQGALRIDSCLAVCSGAFFPVHKDFMMQPGC